MNQPTYRSFHAGERSLRSILRRALLLAGAGFLAACAPPVEVMLRHTDKGDADPPADQSLDGFAGTDAGAAPAPDDAGRDGALSDAAAGDALGPPITCQDGGDPFPVRAGGLTPAETYDYLAIRLRTGIYEASDGGEWTGTESTLLSEIGTACATADATACIQQLARHPTAYVRPECLQNCVEYSVVTTRADVVRRWTTKAEIKWLLGEIDSADDALLLVHASGYAVSCGDPERTSIRAVDGGYEIYATRITKSCTGIVVTRYRLGVSRQGDVSVLESSILSGSPACPGSGS